MATSSSYSFDPSVASMMDEAFERAGVDPQTLTHRHIISAKMSLNLMFIEWAAEDTDTLYRDANTTASVSSGTNNFNLATGAVDVLDLVMQYGVQTTDIPLSRISRQDYLNLANKTQTGQPSMYYVDVATLNTPKVVLWPVPDATCNFTYDYMRRVQTVSTLGETLDMQTLWLEAVASGWAAKLAAKYNVARMAPLTALARESYKIARRLGSGNSRVVITGRGFGASGRMRRR
jgi:hypothetical protein